MTTSDTLQFEILSFSPSTLKHNIHSEKTLFSFLFVLCSLVLLFINSHSIFISVIHTRKYTIQFHIPILLSFAKIQKSTCSNIFIHFPYLQYPNFYHMLLRIQHTSSSTIHYINQTHSSILLQSFPSLSS